MIDSPPASPSFEIRIIRYGPVSYKAEITSPLGTLFTNFKLPFNKQVIEATLLDFRQNLQATRNIPHGDKYTSQVAEALSPEKLGGALFECIFQPYVFELYKASRQQAKHKGQPLQVILNIDPNAGDLINLPWEFLYDTSTQRVRGQFLAFDAGTPVIRRWLRTDPVDFFYDPPLRVLLISTNQEGSSLLNVQREHHLIEDKLMPLNQGGQAKVKIDYLSGATLAKLKQIVRDPRRTPHVIHFMGHGCLGSLLLEGKEGGHKNISEQSLAIVLKNAPSLRLVVLNACETIQTDLFTVQLGVAKSLADAGVPAIVAMQFLISHQASLIFVEEFYQTLAEGHPIDAAVTWGRIAIQNEFEKFATKEWATPLLYLQTPDGYLFTDLLDNRIPLQPSKLPPSSDLSPLSEPPSPSLQTSPDLELPSSSSDPSPLPAPYTPSPDESSLSSERPQPSKAKHKFLRLDTAVPENVEMNRAFDLAVSIRQIFSPVIAEQDLPVVKTSNMRVWWSWFRSHIDLQVQVEAPSCHIQGNDSHSIRLFRNEDSPIFYFHLMPKKSGVIRVIVNVYKKDHCLGSTRIHTIAYKQLVGSVQLEVSSYEFSKAEPLVLTNQNKQDVGSDRSREIILLKRRLQKLREIKAVKGIDTEPAIEIQIEDIEVMLDELYQSNY